MRGRILEAKKVHVEKLNKDKYIVTAVEGNETNVYDCWSADIEKHQGQEIEYNVTPAPEGTTFNSKMVLSTEKKQFTGGGKNYRQFDANQSKVMILSYSKDAVVELIRKSDKSKAPNEIADAIILIYDKLSKHILTEEKPHEPAKEPVKEQKKVTAQEVADSDIPF